MNVPKSLSEIPSEDERQLYDLLVKSLIRIVYPKAEIEDTTVLLDVNSNTFKETGSVITNNGWYAVDALPEKTGLPPVSEGESYSGRYELKQGFTEPPKPYTEADLIAAMETAGKHLEDEEARALMKAENKGLGTPATRAGIINALFHNGYLTKQGKSIIPTAKGIFLIEHLPIEELKSPEMTGHWERRLHDIADGKEDYQAFVSSMEQTVSEWYSAVVSSSDTEKYVSDEDTLCCPFCGAKVIRGKFGYFCSAKKDTGCSFSVGNEICGKAISDAQAIRLIEKCKTTLIKGFKKKDGKGEFDAYLVVDKAAKKIKFEFPAKKK
jgi:DNA topoisomerase-3